MLTKEQIFSADDIKTVDVEVPEWGGTVRLASMSAAARDEYEQMLFRSRDGETIHNLRATLVSCCLVDEAGNLLMGPSEVAELGKKSGRVLGRLFDAAQRVNGMTEADLEDAKGNSGGDPSADSTTG